MWYFLVSLWMCLGGSGWYYSVLGGSGHRLLVWGGGGGEFLSELNGTSPRLMEMGYWDIVLCVWAVFSIFSIIAIFMARSKNTGKGKAARSAL